MREETAEASVRCVGQRSSDRPYVKSPVASLCFVCSSVKNLVSVTMSVLMLSLPTAPPSPFSFPAIALILGYTKCLRAECAATYRLFSIVQYTTIEPSELCKLALFGPRPQRSQRWSEAECGQLRPANREANVVRRKDEKSEVNAVFSRTLRRLWMPTCFKICYMTSCHMTKAAATRTERIEVSSS